MLSSRPKEEIRLKLLWVVEEYLLKKMYLSDEGKDRAEAYRKRIMKCGADALLGTITADFLRDADSVFGTSKRLRRMIGEELCNIFNVEEKLVLEKVQEQGTYSLGFFSISWPSDQTYVGVMQQLLDVKIKEKEKELRHKELRQEVRERLEKGEEKIDSLRDRVFIADKQYANTLASIKDELLMWRLLDDLHNKKIEHPAPIIKAIIDDYKARLIQQNPMPALVWDDVLAEIVQRIESVTFQLEKNIGANGFHIDAWLKEIMNDKIDGLHEFLTKYKFK